MIKHTSQYNKATIFVKTEMNICVWFILTGYVILLVSMFMIDTEIHRGDSIETSLTHLGIMVDFSLNTRMPFYWHGLAIFPAWTGNYIINAEWNYLSIPKIQ